MDEVIHAGGVDVEVEEDRQEWGDEECCASEWEEPEEDNGEVGEALTCGESGDEEGVLFHPDLHHPHAPAKALGDE